MTRALPVALVALSLQSAVAPGVVVVDQKAAARLIAPNAVVDLRRYFPEFSTIVPVAPGWAAFVPARR